MLLTPLASAHITPIHSTRMHESEVQLRVPEMEPHPLIVRHATKCGARMRHLLAAIKPIEHRAETREALLKRAATSRHHVRRTLWDLEPGGQRLAARHAALHEWRDEANDERHLRFGGCAVE